MTYQQTIRNSIVLIIVGFACFILGYMFARDGWQTAGGVKNVSAQATSSQNLGF